MLQIRQALSIMLVLTVGILIGMVINRHPIKIEPASRNSSGTVIRANSFELTDNNGKIRAKLYMAEHGVPELALYDTVSKIPSVRLRVNEDEPKSVYHEKGELLLHSNIGDLSILHPDSLFLNLGKGFADLDTQSLIIANDGKIIQSLH
jgi:hypothetical protein